MKIQSKNLEEVVTAFARLPGIGQKSALRIALHLLQLPREKREHFGNSMQALDRVCRCEHCHNLSDDPLCAICRDPGRNPGLICVVENIQDIMAIEETGQYRGQYHVLGGVISPIEGIGPEDLNIASLLHRIDEEPVSEVIMAISPTIDGETTVYYLSRKLAEKKIIISQIARGVAFGGELQYTDEITLGRSILARIPYSMSDNGM